MAEGEIIMERSKNEFAPFDTGLMRSSGRVELERRGNSFSAVLSYNTDYAWFVHENPYAHHPVGQWKFLEQPIREAEPFIGERLAARVKF